VWLLKNGHLLRFPHPSSLRRMQKIRLAPQGSGALHLAFFEKPTEVVIPASERESRNKNNTIINISRFGCKSFSKR
jgi:hypothetical protein